MLRSHYKSTAEISSFGVPRYQGTIRFRVELWRRCEMLGLLEFVIRNLQAMFNHNLLGFFFNILIKHGL